MVQENQSSVASSTQVSAIRPMLIMATIGLMLVSIFVFTSETAPEWGKYWRIRPLLITPIGSSLGGLFYFFMDSLSSKGKLNKTVAVIAGVMVCFFSLWVSLVLGLDGTLWD